MVENSQKANGFVILFCYLERGIDRSEKKELKQTERLDGGGVCFVAVEVSERAERT
jgi:hypothetical protein